MISVEKFLKWAAKDITDSLPPNEWENIRGAKIKSKYMTLEKYADLDHSDGCPLLGVIVVNEPDSEPVIYLR